MPRPLAELDAERLKGWLRDELAVRPTQARLAFGALRAFINWCADTPAYRGLVTPTIFDTSAVRALLPKKGTKKDCLQREQLKARFGAVRSIENATFSAYLQVLLLTGARREEVAGLTWETVDFRWATLTIKDKVEGERRIPLTPTRFVAPGLTTTQRAADPVALRRKVEAFGLGVCLANGQIRPNSRTTNRAQSRPSSRWH